MDIIGNLGNVEKGQVIIILYKDFIDSYVQIHLAKKISGGLI